MVLLACICDDGIYRGGIYRGSIYDDGIYAMVYTMMIYNSGRIYYIPSSRIQ